MKKRYRIITSLILATLLVTALAVPALAATGQATVGGWDLALQVTNTTDTGTAFIRCTGSPTYVKAQAVNYLYDDANDERGEARNTSSLSYSTASATADEEFPSQKYPGATCHGEVEQTQGNFWVNSRPAGTLFQDGPAFS